jgi:hypothetical protein
VAELSSETLQVPSAAFEGLPSDYSSQPDADGVFVSLDAASAHFLTDEQSSHLAGFRIRGGVAVHSVEILD